MKPLNVQQRQKKKSIPEFCTLKGFESGNPHNLSWIVIDGEVFRECPEPDMQDDLDSLLSSSDDE
jgi:hypothetical protein